VIVGSSGSDGGPGEHDVSESRVQTLAPVTWLFGEPIANSQPEEPTPSQPAQDRAEPTSKQRRGGFDRISNVSMNALARRGMSAEEMFSYLLDREFDAGDVELECERLLGVGLLDDVALAETLVASLQGRKGLGRSAVTAELRRRRIASDAIEEALESLDGDDELERATALAQKRAPQLHALDRATAVRRLSGFLLRKGYSGSTVSAAVQAALGSGSRTPASGGPVFR
jgi:SOS response regulatory protein OraA/RecX